MPAELILNELEFSKLWDLHPSHFHKVQILGRLHNTPRWQQAYGIDYHFSGNVSKALPIPSILEPILKYVKSAIDDGLNGILVNWYDGQLGHYIGRHSDSVRGLIDGSPIVTASFGEQRIFRLRPRKGNGYIDFQTENGSLFIMPYSTNKNWTHEVTASKKYQGMRISVTFRAFAEVIADRER